MRNEARLFSGCYPKKENIEFSVKCSLGYISLKLYDKYFQYLEKNKAIYVQPFESALCLLFSIDRASDLARIQSYLL